MLRDLQKIFLYSILIALGAFATTTGQVKSEEAPIFWITWNAENYSAPEYIGKTIPVYNTPINVAFELVQDGKMVPLSSREVRWYLDEVMVKKGFGAKEYSFRVSKSVGSHFVRIEIPGINGGSSLLKGVRIPVTSPEIVLDVPYIRSAISVKEFTIRALPYYFNVIRGSDLEWRWRVNNNSPTGNVDSPGTLTIELPEGTTSGSQVLTSVNIINSINPSESAETLALFTIQ